MEVKRPLPQVLPAVWSEFKDLQEWEKYHQERPEDDNVLPRPDSCRLADAIRCDGR